jgi:hypothetical protein
MRPHHVALLTPEELRAGLSPVPKVLDLEHFPSAGVRKRRSERSFRSGGGVAERAL